MENSIDAAEEDGLRISGYFGHVSAVLAVGIFLWQAVLDGGWLEAAFGRLATFFWLLVAVWLIVSVLAIRRRQHWWVILTAAFAMYPPFMATLLFAACLQGNCL